MSTRMIHVRCCLLLTVRKSAWLLLAALLAMPGAASAADCCKSFLGSWALTLPEGRGGVVRRG